MHGEIAPAWRDGGLDHVTHVAREQNAAAHAGVLQLVEEVMEERASPYFGERLGPIRQYRLEAGAESTA